jgi:hypothetical protein
MHFSRATLQLGRELSDSKSGTGYQDAITPPWQTKLALFVYIGSVATVGIIWWKLGWVSGFGCSALIIFGSLLAKLILPKPTSDHYKGQIIRSMCSRYADFVRDGDSIRANAMKQLLAKADINPDDMKSA